MTLSQAKAPYPPHLCLQSGCLVNWQRGARKAEDVEQIAQEIVFHRDTETATGGLKTWKGKRRSESDGIIWRQSNHQPKPGFLTVRGKSEMQSWQFEHTCRGKRKKQNMYVIQVLSLQHFPHSAFKQRVIREK